MRGGVPVAVLLCLFGARADAGAWLRSEAESYYSARLEYSTATRYWDRNGDRKDLSCDYQSRKFSNYYEYGLSYYYTVLADLSLERASCNADSTSGLGDLRLGVRGRLDPYRNGRAWEVILILPTGYPTGGNVRLGGGEIGVELGISRRDPLGIDQEIEFETGAIEYGAGARIWAGDQPVQIFAYLRGTHLLAPRWTLSAKLEGEFAVNGDETQVAVPSSDRGSDFKFAKLSVEVTHKMTSQWRMTAGASEHIWGENVTHNRGIHVAFSRLWR